MRELVRGLSDAHRVAQAEFLASATNSLDALRKILTVLISQLHRLQIPHKKRNELTCDLT